MLWRRSLLQVCSADKRFFDSARSALFGLSVVHQHPTSFVRRTRSRQGVAAGQGLTRLQVVLKSGVIFFIGRFLRKTIHHEVVRDRMNYVPTVTVSGGLRVTDFVSRFPRDASDAHEPRSEVAPEEKARTIARWMWKTRLAQVRGRAARGDSRSHSVSENRFVVTLTMWPPLSQRMVRLRPGAYLPDGHCGRCAKVCSQRSLLLALSLTL